MELGATELYKALAAAPPPAGLPHSDPMYYLPLAPQRANAYITGQRRS
jgi:endoglucanase